MKIAAILNVDGFNIFDLWKMLEKCSLLMSTSRKVQSVDTAQLKSEVRRRRPVEMECYAISREIFCFGEFFILKH